MDDNIGSRIGQLIEALDMKKVRFAERIKVDQSYITQLTNGKRNPSDRTIADICREFNVREKWLRNGNGEMFLDFTEDEFSKAATILSNDAFVRSLIIEYWKLDECSKRLFRDFIHKLSNGMKNYEASASNSSSLEQSATEEAEAAYIKSRSNFAAKTKSSVLNTTADTDKAANQ